MSDAGIKLYNRIYHGRPDYYKKTNDNNYYFHCSKEQAFHYFRRFDNDTAIIKEPPELVEEMINFHSGVLSAAYGIEIAKEDNKND